MSIPLAVAVPERYHASSRDATAVLAVSIRSLAFLWLTGGDALACMDVNAKLGESHVSPSPYCRLITCQVEPTVHLEERLAADQKVPLPCSGQPCVDSVRLLTSGRVVMSGPGTRTAVHCMPLVRAFAGGGSLKRELYGYGVANLGRRMMVSLRLIHTIGLARLITTNCECGWPTHNHTRSATATFMAMATPHTNSLWRCSY